jgi:hypothetical protein
MVGAWTPPVPEAAMPAAGGGRGTGSSADELLMLPKHTNDIAGNNPFPGRPGYDALL